MTDLLDLLDEEEQAADPRAHHVHSLLPAMGYVCGGTPLGLADGGPPGHLHVGGWGTAEQWSLITCPDCRAVGRRAAARRAHLQQTWPHDCTSDCSWTTLDDLLADALTKRVKGI